MDLWKVEDPEERLLEFAKLVEEGKITAKTLQGWSESEKREYLIDGPAKEDTAVVTLDLPHCLSLCHFVLPTDLISFLDRVNPIIGEPSAYGIVKWQKPWKSLRYERKLDFRASEKQKHEDGYCRELEIWVKEQVIKSLEKQKEKWKIVKGDTCTKCGSDSSEFISKFVLVSKEKGPGLCLVGNSKGCATVPLLTEMFPES